MAQTPNIGPFANARATGFNAFAVGDKRYGASGRLAPNIGPTSSPEGYKTRDLEAAARKAAIIRRMLSSQKSGNIAMTNLQSPSGGGPIGV